MFFTGGSDSRRRRKDAERDRERARRKDDRDRDRDRKSRTSTGSARKVSSSSLAREREREREERDRDRPRIVSPSPERSDRKISAEVVPEMHRRPSATGSSNYPSFSRAHSKEAVGSPEDVVNPRMSLYTPDPTDLGSPHKESATATPPRGGAPPSPPLTAAGDPEVRRVRSGTSIKRNTPEKLKVDTKRRSSLDAKIRPSVMSRSKTSKYIPKSDQEKQKRSETPNSPRSSPAGSKQASIDTSSSATPNANQQAGLSTDARSHGASTETASITGSDSTSVPRSKAPERPPPAPPRPPTTTSQSSPSSVTDPSPRTPTPHDSVFPPIPPSAKQASGIDVLNSPGYPSPFTQSLPNSAAAPPPPPPLASVEIPRVDYLLQNGGLTHTVPKKFLYAASPVVANYASQPFTSPQAFTPQPTLPLDITKNVFAPFQTVLDDYLNVVTKNGSLAVATGYRSVARRLLDRLEQVFNRNISSEKCDCLMCRSSQPQPSANQEDVDGVSWGEILEYVSGRRELPPWPPFAITTEMRARQGLGLGADEDLAAPMQKLDIDVPDDYREHYIRQSKKTKDSVQAWLASQPELPSSPPQEVDDETLCFAMMTHLEPQNQRLFAALLKGMQTLPTSRVPTPATPAGLAKPELITKTSRALQRLYRLQTHPRDPECALYLLKYPATHSVLATIAAISAQEWDILVSGRFDGFLWSGAESPATAGAPQSRGPSRGPTPVTPASAPRTPFSAGQASSRGGTPFSPLKHSPSRGPTSTPATNTSGLGRYGAPVQMDEETEIAVLAEIEREIYAGMEALEDAFEALHAKAEHVRDLLRKRGAGLSMAANVRRGSATDAAATLGTPDPNGSGNGGLSGWGWARERDEGDNESVWEDVRSELAPDDSASNISRRRRRRRHGDGRKSRTATVEEADEGSETGEEWRRRR